MLTVEEMLDHIIKAEGGYVDDPYDKGGATNWGVTRKTLSEWRGREVSKQEVMDLTENEARDIYTSEYFTRPKVDTIPGELQPIVFDMVVNHGPRKGIKILQRAVKAMGYPISCDGIIGPQSSRILREACKQKSWETVNNRVVEERIHFYESIVAVNPTQARFLKGWLRRANTFKVKAI